jgi:hypothetical protein
LLASTNNIFKGGLDRKSYFAKNERPHLQISLYDLLKKAGILKNVKMKSTKYFEQFLIIGVNQTSLEGVEGDIERLVPENLIQ